MLQCLLGRSQVASTMEPLNAYHEFYLPRYDQLNARKRKWQSRLLIELQRSCHFLILFNILTRRFLVYRVDVHLPLDIKFQLKKSCGHYCYHSHWWSAPIQYVPVFVAKFYITLITESSCYPL